jgi:Tol biopolymer transport system component
MTPNRSAEERISTWLAEVAPKRLPDGVLEAAFERTRAGTQRRGVRGWRNLAMLRLTPAVVAAGAAAIVLAVIGAVLIAPSTQPTGDNPSRPPAASSSAAASPSPSVPVAASVRTQAVVLGGDVALSRTVDGNTDIYLAPADGAGIRRLTDDPAIDQFATWTPDGTSMLVTRTTSIDPELSDIVLVDVRTGAEVVLTGGGGRHAGGVMSPDGTRIAYERSPSEPGFHVMDADGSNDRLAYAIHDDQWNLQGSWASNHGVYAKRGPGDLLIVDVDTGSVTTVVSGSLDLGDVALSPDGTTFAFRSRRGDGGAFLMGIDGSNVRPVVTTTTKGPISWAPDGRHLILAQPDGWLYVVATDGTGMIRWTQGTSAVPRPTR